MWLPILTLAASAATVIYAPGSRIKKSFLSRLRDLSSPCSALLSSPTQATSKASIAYRSTDKHLSTMKPTTFVFAALAGSVAAQYYNVSSNAFRLFIKSDNSSIDG
jgi:hypothetical protein